MKKIKNMKIVYNLLSLCDNLFCIVFLISVFARSGETKKPRISVFFQKTKNTFYVFTQKHLIFSGFSKITCLKKPESINFVHSG